MLEAHESRLAGDGKESDKVYDVFDRAKHTINVVAGEKDF